MSLEIRPISIAKANDFVEALHRHHGKKTGCRFAIAVFDGGGATRSSDMLKSSSTQRRRWPHAGGVEGVHRRGEKCVLNALRCLCKDSEGHGLSQDTDLYSCVGAGHIT